MLRSHLKKVQWIVDFEKREHFEYQDLSVAEGKRRGKWCVHKRKKRKETIDVYLQRLQALLLAQVNWHLLTRRKRQEFSSLEMKSSSVFLQSSECGSKRTNKGTKRLALITFLFSSNVPNFVSKISK